MKIEKLEIDGLKTQFLRAGTGPVRLVILPGWGGSGTTWGKFLARFDHEKKWSAGVLDLPGFGAADPPPVPWTAKNYADFVAAAIEKIPGAVPGNFVILGHSHGGRTAARLLADRPDFARGAVLAAAAIVPARRDFRGHLAAAAKFLREKIPALEVFRRAARRFFGSADWREIKNPVVARTFQNLIAEDSRGLLPKISKIPGRIFWGTDDRLTSIRDGRAVAAALPGWDFLEIAGARHGLHHDAPEILERGVREFLRSVFGE